MAKRFSATEIWDEDWFLDMPNEYKLFWYYMLANCDHAGLFKVNLKSFCSLLGVRIFEELILDYFNLGKHRIRVVTKSLWFVEDFFVFQYGQIFNPNNKMHESIDKIYKRHGINILEVRGLKEVKERTKRGQEGVFDTLKDKDKDKDKEIDIKYSKDSLTPKMVEVFKKSYPFYPVDEKEDFTSCLNLAYKIAKQKGWQKDSVLNGNLSGTLEAWEKIVLFSTTDKWYATRSISDFNREFQRIVQGMVQVNKKTTGKEENKSTAPPLSRLNNGI